MTEITRMQDQIKRDITHLREEMNEAQAVRNDFFRRITPVHQQMEELNQTTNAKLYDISAEASEADLDRHFESFCEDEWDMFSRYMEDHDIQPDALGSTSSFYIRPKDTHIMDGNFESIDERVYRVGQEYDLPEIFTEYDSVEDYVESLMTDIHKSDLSSADELTMAYVDSLTDEDDLDHLYDMVEDIRNTLRGDIEYYSENVEDRLFKDLESMVDRVHNGYQYLVNFKRDQLRIWEEYLARYEDTDEAVRSERGL